MLRPRRRRCDLAVAPILLAVVSAASLLQGCGGKSGSDTAADTTGTTAAVAPGGTGTSGAPTAAGQAATTGNAPGTTAAAGTNPLFPLTPGFQSVRQGFVNKGSRRLEHRLVFTVTDVAKDIEGTRTLAAVDQDFDGGELAEQSLDWFAIDKDGNVRYLGSYTETYEGGRFVNATDAWLGGVKGAKSGILLPGTPKVGTPAFTQAVVPGEGTARAKVVKTGEKKCVPFKCYENVVVLEENGEEHKYFAPGVGGILTEPLSGDPQETEELINVTQLSPQGLAEISNEAVKLDQHARTVAKDVYGPSAPAARTS